MALVAVLAGIVWAPSMARAHDLSQSDSRIEIDGSTVRVRLTIDLLEIPDVDVDRDGLVSYEELDRAIERTFDRIKQHFQLSAAAMPARIVLDRHRIVDGHMLEADLRYTFNQEVTRLEATSTFPAIMRPGHRHLMTMTSGRAVHQAVLDASNPTTTFVPPGITFNRILASLAGLAGLVCLAVYRLAGGRGSAKTI
jgi:hypothetical protein